MEVADIRRIASAYPPYAGSCETELAACETAGANVQVPTPDKRIAREDIGK